jgi:hypothetical protein
MYTDTEVRWSGVMPGTPQQIWDGFTRHTGAYLWPIEYEPRVGGAERGLTSGGGTVTAWEPLRHFRTEARRPDGWHNALDYRLDGTHLTFVHTSVMDELAYEQCVRHTRLYNHSLGEYLRHFAGRSPHHLAVDDVPGSSADVLERLGIPAGAGAGDRVELGTVDYRDGGFVGVRTEHALLRVYGRDAFGHPVGFSIHSFDGSAPDERAWRERLAA